MDTEETEANSHEESKLESSQDGKKVTQTSPTSEIAAKPEAKFTQEDLNRIVKRELADAARKAAKAAEEQAALAKGEFEKLATTYKGELDMLRPKYEAAITSLNSLLESEIANLPEKVRDLKPATDDPALLIEWLPKAKKLAEDMGGTDKTLNSNPRGPKAKGESKDDLVEANKKVMRGRGIYQGF